MAEYAIIPYADYLDACDAVREKTETTGKIVSGELGAAIRSIETGGDFSEVDFLLDEINGEVVGETPYTVTFIGVNSTELGAVSVFEGYDCPDPVATGVFETPTKESTRYINYTFSGWALTEGGAADPDVLKAIETDTTVYAVFAEEYIYLAKGNCGNAVYDSVIVWTINPDYVLELTGSGRTEDDYSVSGAPWSGYADKITSVIVNEGITYLGWAAFENLTAATDAVLPASVSLLSVYLFRGCSSLANIALPTKNLIIMNDVFDNCVSLKNITFPAKTYAIYYSAFTGCTALESAVFEETEGWCVGSTLDVTTAFAEADISDPAAMATWLVNNSSTSKILVRNGGNES